MVDRWVFACGVCLYVCACVCDRLCVPVVFVCVSWCVFAMCSCLSVCVPGFVSLSVCLCCRHVQVVCVCVARSHG